MNDLPPRTRHGTLGDGLSRLLTGAIKLAGLIIAVDQIFVTPHPQLAALGLSGFMMAGAQFSERGLTMLLDRLFGQEPPSPPKDTP